MPSPHPILIVDDDSDNRFLLVHGLRKVLPDFSFIECSSAAEALALLKTRTVEAILTDHHLGDQSGCEFIGQVRRRGLICPLVMVTGSDDPKVEKEAYLAGATKVFVRGRGDYAGFVGRLLGKAGQA